MLIPLHTNSTTSSTWQWRSANRYGIWYQPLPTNSKSLRHIAENLYWEPGLTLLYRRKDLLDDGK
jgi:hypothetical protein